MTAFEDILVPFDGSEASIRALDAAVSISDDGAKITLLQVVDEPYDDDPTAVVAKRMAGTIYDEEEAKLEAAQYWEGVDEALERVAKEAKAKTDEDVTINIVVKTGDAATIIADYANANANGIDIIVMGRRGLGKVRAMLGSVSQSVAHDTDLPLLLVR